MAWVLIIIWSTSISGPAMTSQKIEMPDKTTCLREKAVAEIMDTYFTVRAYCFSRVPSEK